MPGISASVERKLSPSSSILLDCHQVTFIDSTGLGFLIRTFRQAERIGCQMFLVGITAKARAFFELNRTWDLFQKQARDRMDEALANLATERKLPPFFHLLTRQEGFNVLDLNGRLDAQQTAALDMTELTSAVSGRNCILNLGQLDFVDSAGLIFFFKIQRRLVNSGQRCVLCGLNENVRRLFQLTKLTDLFRIAPDLATARQILEEQT